MSFIIAILLIFSSLSSSSCAVPLSTRSRWIVDDSGKRVKLACVNWAGHIQMLPEGLNKQPLSNIAKQISSMGFNCVRLTYATYMFTRHGHLNVGEYLEHNKLTLALEGVKKHNPNILNLSVWDAQKAVIDALGSQGVMVILDCHVSKPKWCCNDNDGNGFFGDQYFDPQDWLNALSTVAKRYINTPMVIGMSLRNEFRGRRQDQNVWYTYVEQGANLIHKKNPNVLILISGLGYDIDLSFLKKKPLNLNLHNKLVYEIHRYAFSQAQYGFWSNTSINYMCQKVAQEIEAKSGFLRGGRQNGAPLMLTEFGIDLDQNSQPDTSFVTCLLAWLAENDLDWAIWSGHGSYYLRDGKQDADESYGMFDGTWSKVRNPGFHTKLQLVQQILQAPFSTQPMDRVMYHPLSGSCGMAQGNEVQAGDCLKTSVWSFNGDGSPIRLKGSNQCLKAAGEGSPVVLTDYCSGESSSWKLAPKSMYQLSNGNGLCLHFDSSISNKVLTKKCIVTDPDYVKLPGQESQWFVLVQSNTK
ncbi:OLC1v1029898C1 [Oldenlandia corymbosa var. corymbosa]|uniref:OLC1v1029898C1 n=1 Tax=Oldenlandia corymbosa var. corymbosa TaxID=529605 RepID=A0AAV1CET5_OLDCO|nr:OLC1v1029898C1 [Oldenlandia corymbosa var. corymbosa]